MVTKIEINFTNKWLYSLIAVGVLSILGIGAWAYNSNMQGGNPSIMGHSADEVMVNVNGQQESLQEAINSGKFGGGWTLLTQGTEWTEESLTTINSSGITPETDAGFSGQRIDFGNFNWPTSNPHKILLRVKNRGDDFCVGGNGTGNRASSGIGVYAKCTDFRYQGTTLTKVNVQPRNWIQMYINGKKMIGCPDMLGRSPNPGYPGKYGHPDFDTFCIYDNPTYWTGNLKSIKIETADWSKSYSTWEWEVWYK